MSLKESAAEALINPTGQNLPEAEQQRRGLLIAETLQLKKKRVNGRFDTAWGDKTAIGLFLTVKRIIDEGV